MIDLLAPAVSDAHPWVAMIWPDERAGGWTRALWPPDPSRRSWCRTMKTAPGDVIEFGARHASTAGAVVRKNSP
jgi:hypothetical protein